MAVTMADITKLRKMSGAGMMDCKKALTESDGDIEKAMEIIRKKGQAIAAKRSDREAAEGCVLAKKDGEFAAIIALKCETDFVAKNEDFIALTQAILDAAVANKCKTLDEVKALPMGKGTVQDAVTDRSGITGEKMELDGYNVVEGAYTTVYNHMGKNQLCTIAAFNKESEEAAHNIAMQIAAMSPQYISREDISDDELAKMREITIDSALNDVSSLPKPIQKDIFAEAFASDALNAEDKAILEEKQNDKYLFNFLSKEAIAALAAIAMSKKEAIMANKIFNGLVEGRISKQLKEVCLLDQTYVMAADGKQTVKAYLAEVSKEVGATVALKSFVRFETGEGIEKKEEDFAAEVAKQMK